MELNDYVKHENDPQVVKINVGGKVFTTTISTLTKPIINRRTQNPTPSTQKDAFFAANLSAHGRGHLLKEIFENYAYNKENLIFIDRSPRFFGMVLNYLRTIDKSPQDFFNTLDTTEFSSRGWFVQMLTDEFKFYKIF